MDRSHLGSNCGGAAPSQRNLNWNLNWNPIGIELEWLHREVQWWLSTLELLTCTLKRVGWAMMCTIFRELSLSCACGVCARAVEEEALCLVRDCALIKIREERGTNAHGKILRAQLSPAAPTLTKRGEKHGPPVQHCSPQPHPQHDQTC